MSKMRMLTSPCCFCLPQNRELQIMRKLDHCNIVRLRYFFYSSGDKVSWGHCSSSCPASYVHPTPPQELQGLGTLKAFELCSSFNLFNLSLQMCVWIIKSKAEGPRSKVQAPRPARCGNTLKDKWHEYLSHTFIVSCSCFQPFILDGLPPILVQACPPDFSACSCAINLSSLGSRNCQTTPIVDVAAELVLETLPFKYLAALLDLQRPHYVIRSAQEV